jgi:hypothetical protein
LSTLNGTFLPHLLREQAAVQAGLTQLDPPMHPAAGELLC